MYMHICIHHVYMHVVRGTMDEEIGHIGDRMINIGAGKQARQGNMDALDVRGMKAGR